MAVAAVAAAAGPAGVEDAAAAEREVGVGPAAGAQLLDAARTTAAGPRSGAFNEVMISPRKNTTPDERVGRTCAATVEGMRADGVSI